MPSKVSPDRFSTTISQLTFPQIEDIDIIFHSEYIIKMTNATGTSYGKY
jgi:hypothetical protein